MTIGTANGLQFPMRKRAALLPEINEVLTL